MCVYHLAVSVLQARVVGLPGTGLLELASSNLEKEAGIGLSFRTQNSDGLILLAKSRTVSFLIAFHINCIHLFLLCQSK